MDKEYWIVLLILLALGVITVGVAYDLVTELRGVLQ